jgi:hypothetical protein
MDTRIFNIRTKFNVELTHFHKSLGLLENTQNSLNTPSTSKVLKESTAKEQTPLMLKKINRFKVELGKNNMKKIQQPFTFHGDIDSYLEELTQVKEVN